MSMEFIHAIGHIIHEEINIRTSHFALFAYNQTDDIHLLPKIRLVQYAIWAEVNSIKQNNALPLFGRVAWHSVLWMREVHYGP